MSLFRAEPLSRRLLFTLGLFALTMIAAMAYALNTGTRMSRKHAPLIDAAMEIQLAATTAHLWFEEILSGDRHERMEDVWALLDSADWHARAMLEGGRTADKAITALEDPDLRIRISEVRGKLEEFEVITRERWDIGRSSAAGTEIDQRYDAVFKEFITLAGGVESDVRQRISDDIVIFRRLQLSLMAAVIALAVLAAGVLSKYVNDRARAEAALRRSEQELRLTFENTPIAVAVLDMETSFIEVNQALCSLLGRGADELVGLAYRALVHPDDADRVSTFLRELIGGAPSPAQMQHRFSTPEGGTLYGFLHVGRIPSSPRRPQRIVAQIVDRTEQVEAEEEARDHRERLAHVTRLGTMGEMAAGIAHEINQPLTAISASAQACERLIRSGRAETQEQLDTLQLIGRSALRAGEVIRRLRAFARRDKSGRDVADISELVRGVVTLAEIDVRARDARIGVEVEDGLPRVIVDRVQVEQVILNLIRNGLDAMQDADGQLTVRTERGPDGDVEIRVRDTGSGITEETEEKLFTPFHTTKEGGMGLGLSMSRSIIASHGGRLWFTRNEGRGTTFHVSLPTVEGGRDERA